MGRKLQKQAYSDQIYTNVLTMVKQGTAILDAVNHIGMCVGTFYYHLTKAQKSELRLAKFKQAYSDEMYPKVLAMVEDGYTIQQAINTIGMPRTSFFYHLTKPQKSELKAAKVSHRGKYQSPQLIQE